LNGTWTLENQNDAPGTPNTRLFFMSNNASVSATQTATIVGYPALQPIFIWGDDDTGASGTGTTHPGVVYTQVDFFSLAWNKAIASPATVPNKLKSRYW